MGQVFILIGWLLIQTGQASILIGWVSIFIIWVNILIGQASNLIDQMLMPNRLLNILHTMTRCKS